MLLFLTAEKSFLPLVSWYYSFLWSVPQISLRWFLAFPTIMQTPGRKEINPVFPLNLPISHCQPQTALKFVYWWLSKDEILFFFFIQIQISGCSHIEVTSKRQNRNLSRLGILRLYLTHHSRKRKFFLLK